MGQCFGAPVPAGLEDSEAPDSKFLNVWTQSNGFVEVWALPTDTMAIVDNKIVQAFGKQPQVFVMGRFKERQFKARIDNKWFPLRWDATVQEVGKNALFKF